MIKEILLPTVAFIALSVPAFADDTLYSNGPISGDYNAWNIYGSTTISDSFTIDGPSVLTGVTYGDWSEPGAENQPLSIQWSIGTTVGASDIGSGVATLTDTLFLANNDYNGDGSGYSVWSSSFSLPDLSVGPQTFYLTLQDASPSPQYWDVNNGPSTGFFSANGGLTYQSLFGEAFPGVSSTTAFSISGYSAPEPNFHMIDAALFACITAVVLLRRRKTSRLSQ